MVVRRTIPILCLVAVLFTVAGVMVDRQSKENKHWDEIIGTAPGAQPHSPELKARLGRALVAKGAEYAPRTEHLRPDGSPKYTNRLILESSPYLLQHAHNPVDWYPWGDEAFERARAEGRPVLLSVGYSTCHWCHVMERESFEDEEIASFLNANYICIKVDREVRPDIDGIYMAAVQMISGGGGWPMTVWLTPDRRPFYGGTYFPPRDRARGGRPGFLTVLEKLRESYHQEGGDVEKAAANMAERIRRALAPEPGLTEADAGTLDRAFAYFQSSFDSRYGGFGRAPKFPRTVSLEFLLRYHKSRSNRSALEMVTKTLEAMAAGGIYDQVGGGFHRYSTDARWLVPHFEKMLYDNAQLAIAYLEGYQATGRRDFAELARDILRYVEREMTAPGGAFYSATDADSEGGEGMYFVWTPEEIERTVGPRLAEVVKTVFGVTQRGNFEGRNILYLPYTLPAAALRLGQTEALVRGMVKESRELLYRERQRRVPPATDRKILSAWNGLMIAAFARAGTVLEDPALTARAEAAARFVLDKLSSSGQLMRSYKDGVAARQGYLEDYAFMIAALIELYESSFDQIWLQQALTFQRTLDQEFWDSEVGGYYMTAATQNDLLAREKPDYDGAEPSGNSVGILNLLRLAELTDDDGFRDRADACLSAFSRVLERAPAAVPKMLVALDFRLEKPKEVVIVASGSIADAEPLLAKVRTTFVPNKVLMVVAESDVPDRQRLVPLLEGKRALGGKSTGYVCKGRVCDLPTSDPEVFARQLVE